MMQKYPYTMDEVYGIIYDIDSNAFSNVFVIS